MSFEYHRSPHRDQRGLRLRPKKCLHLYKYLVHPQFGFMSARLQSWFPFNIQICLNSREWLGRQLRRRRSTFKRADNCFTIARTRDFKVLRPAHDEPRGKLEWRPLRKGVADLHRRAQLSQPSNDAYLEALSAVEGGCRPPRLSTLDSRLHLARFVAPSHESGE